MPRLAQVVAALVVLVTGCSGGDGGGSGAKVDTTPPAVAALAPSDHASDVPPGVIVEATFDEAIDPASVTTSTFVVEVLAAPVAGITTASGRVARFTPAAPLPERAVVTARLTTGIRDLAGNPLATASTWSFTVADPSPPRVVAVAPSAGAVDVQTGAVVAVDFSEPVLPSSVTASAVTLSIQGGGQVSASTTVSGARVTLEPAASLAYATTYEVRVATTVTDLAGNPLQAPFSSSFTTRASPPPSHPPGSLDVGFAGTGVARIDLGGANDKARSLAIRGSDGRIALGGLTDAAPYGARIVRLRSDGQPDAGFGSAGILAPGPAFSCASGVGFQSAGLLVAVLTEGGDTFATARFDDAGILDPSFAPSSGTGGVVRPGVGTAFNSCSTRMAIQPDDRILLAGERATTTGLIRPIMTVVRLKADGDLDPSFGTGGVAMLDRADVRSTSWAVAPQPDGKILVAGWSYWDVDAVSDAIVWRLDSTGRTDSSFGTAGIARVHVGPPGSNERVVGVAVDAVGRLLVAVDSYFSGAYSAALVRLDASGTLDPSFATGGIATTLAGPWWGGLAVQPDRKPFMAGGAGAGLAVARFGTDGALDPVFGTGGVASFAAGPFPFAVGLQADGKIVVVGEVSDLGLNDVAVARLWP